jgi:hypothetical protein
MTATNEPDWSTPEGLRAIKEALAATIDGWEPPAAYAVGITPASSSPELEFPYVNGPDAPAGLAAVVLAKVVGHASGSATYELSQTELSTVVETLKPALACEDVEHPNTAAWAQVLRDLEANPARTAYAVFVGDLDAPVESEAEATLRTLLPTD